MSLPSSRPIVNVRRHLSADALHALVRRELSRIPDHRRAGCPIALSDALMAGYAMFVLKDPSLLAFDERRQEANLRNLFGLQAVPSDTQMREILDPVDPDGLRPTFGAVFRQVQRGRVLKKLVFYQGAYLLLLDGTEYFSSQQIHCAGCLHRTHRPTGVVTYHHQMLGAVLAHPDCRAVLPLPPEPIIQQDGTSKNDCEQNAAKRFLRRLRQEHPHLKLIVVEDALASNGPHIRELRAQDIHFLLVVKPGEHAALFDQVTVACEQGRAVTWSWQEGEVRCQIRYVNGLPLNAANPDLLVNFLHYVEYGADGEIRSVFSWITDLTIRRQNAPLFVRGGRARWKVENETFNTLKNQGYHYEHNYGHGQKHLSVVFALLMMLAFLTDQVQQLSCPLFQAVQHKHRSKRALWDHLRSHFRHFTFHSMKHLYEVMLYDLAKGLPAPEYADTS